MTPLEYVPVPCVTCGELVSDAERCSSKTSKLQHHNKDKCCDPVRAWERLPELVNGDD